VSQFIDVEAEQTERFNRIVAQSKQNKNSHSVPANQCDAEFMAGCPEQLKTKPFDCSSIHTISDNFLIEMKDLKPREWIIEHQLLRGRVSCTFAPGGTGKSMFNLSLGISITANIPMMGFDICEPCNVLLINNEDDDSEIKRRVAGTLISQNIKPADINGKFHYYSGYGNPLMVAEKLQDGTTIQAPNVEALKKFIIDNKIGVLFVDPFISTHAADENNNRDIDKVIGIYKQIAYETRCAISLTHHTRKLGGAIDAEAHAGDPDIGRGAASLKDASRCVVTLTRMGNISAKKLEYTPGNQARHIRADIGKNNYGAPDTEAFWFKMMTVEIPNGDEVGVPHRVNLGPLFEKADSKDGRVKWTSHRVAETIHHLISKDETPFNEIKSRLMAENTISDTQARNIINMVSYNEAMPTTILINGNYFKYWLLKKNATAPIIVHRREQ